MATQIEQQQIAQRYGRAYYDTLDAQDRAGALSQLESLVSLMDTSSEFDALCNSPLLSAHDRGEGVALIAKKTSLPSELIALLEKMAHYGRLSLLPKLADAYAALLREADNVRDVELITARALDEKKLESMTASIAASLGTSVNMHVVVDPSIIGGIKIRIGARELDASVKGKLSRVAADLYDTIQRV